MGDFITAKDVIVRKPIAKTQLSIPKAVIAANTIESLIGQCHHGMYCLSAVLKEVSSVKFYGVDMEAYMDIGCSLTGKMYFDHTIVGFKVDSIQNTQKGSVIILSNKYSVSFLCASIRQLQVGDVIPMSITKITYNGNSLKAGVDLPSRWVYPNIGLTGEVPDIDDGDFTIYSETIAAARNAAGPATVKYVDDILGLKYPCKFQVDLSGESMGERGFLAGFGPQKNYTPTKFIDRSEALKVARGVYRLQAESYCELLALEIKMIKYVWKESPKRNVK